jgi:predicted secreted protein
MSTDAILAQGTKFAVSANESPPTFSDIPEIKTIGGPDGSAPTIDVTDLDSTAREYKLGLKDEGSFSLGIMYIPANAVHTQLRDAWADRTELRFRVTFTDTGTTVWEFNGFVTGFAQNAAVDTVVEATVGIKITGAIYETT